MKRVIYNLCLYCNIIRYISLDQLSLSQQDISSRYQSKKRNKNVCEMSKRCTDTTQDGNNFRPSLKYHKISRHLSGRQKTINFMTVGKFQNRHQC